MEAPSLRNGTVILPELVPLSLVFDRFDLGRQRAGDENLQFRAQLDALAEKVE